MSKKVVITMVMAVVFSLASNLMAGEIVFNPTTQAWEVLENASGENELKLWQVQGNTGYEFLVSTNEFMIKTWMAMLLTAQDWGNAITVIYDDDSGQITGVFNKPVITDGNGDFVESIAGSWSMVANGYAFTLMITQNGTDIFGTMVLNQNGLVYNVAGTVNGSSINFTNDINTGQVYDGVINGSAMTGTFHYEGESTLYQWSAQR